ncbi:MAG: 50S ribosomal protein L10 [Bacteroidales bacterium]
MKREEKNAIIDQLVEEIQTYKHFYITDIGGLNAADTSLLRRKCFDKQVKLMVVKNTLLKKALERINGEVYEPLYSVLKDSTSLMLSTTGNAPAKLIKDFRSKDKTKPVLKAAFVEESIYIGDNQLELLVNLKSKDELLGDIVGLLQSPAKNVLSALLSGKNTLGGIVKTLSERTE